MKKVMIAIVILFTMTSNSFTQQEPNKVAKTTASDVKKVITLEEGKDPVCKMHVEKEAKNTSTYKGKKVIFCSIVCKEMFDKNPEKYVTKNIKK